MGSLSSELDLGKLLLFGDCVCSFTAEYSLTAHKTFILRLGVLRFDLLFEGSFSLRVLVVNHLINFDDDLLGSGA